MFYNFKHEKSHFSSTRTCKNVIYGCDIWKYSMRCLVSKFTTFTYYCIGTVLQKPDFLSINLLQNAKTYRKWAALIINSFGSKYNLFNPWQTYRGRRIDPSWVMSKIMDNSGWSLSLTYYYMFIFISI